MKPKFRTDSKIINVKDYGAKGDGITDDSKAIQNAMVNNSIVYFPEGSYLLESKNRPRAFIHLSAINTPKEIRFHQKAKIIISKNQSEDHTKAVVFFLHPTDGNIKSVKFEGVTIEGNSKEHSRRNTAIQVYYNQRFMVDTLICNNITLMNMGGAGIHTGARNNFLSNIYTENCGSHAIAATNKANRKYKVYIEIDSFLSVNDQRYTIDLGKQIKNLRTDKLDAKISNVTSINSKHGIKTAGEWNVEFENIYIRNSQTKGFYINFDATNNYINFKNAVFENISGPALNLKHETKVNLDNIKIINCDHGIFIGAADVSIDNLFIDGKNRTEYFLRTTGGNLQLKNFYFKNPNQETLHPVWIGSKQSSVKAGSLFNFNSGFPIIIHRYARDITIENVKLENTTRNDNELNILNIQEKPSFEILDRNEREKSNYKVIIKN